MGSYDGGGKMGRNSTQTGAGGPKGTGGASKGTAGGNVGGTKKAGTAAVADHMIATGQISAPSIPGGGVAQGNYSSQDNAYNDYSGAVGDYATRNFGNRLADFLGGSFYNENEPMAGNPRSFSGGKFHSSSNPGGVLAGLVAPYGSGLIAGPVGSAIYNKAGLPEVWHGGLDQPDVRTGPFGNAPAGTDLGKTFADMGGLNGAPGANPGQGAPRSGGYSNTGNGGNAMAAFQGPTATAPGGAAFGPQPSAPQQDPMSAFFRPRVPNHSVPQGYQSAFPNSLSPEDMALLYGKALA